MRSSLESGPRANGAPASKIEPLRVTREPALQEPERAVLPDGDMTQFNPRRGVAYLLVRATDASLDARRQHPQSPVASANAGRGELRILTTADSASPVQGVTNATTAPPRWIPIALIGTEIGVPVFGIMAAATGVASNFSAINIKQVRSYFSDATWTASGVAGFANGLLKGKDWQTYGPCVFDIIAGSGATAATNASYRQNPDPAAVKIAGVTSGAAWGISGTWKTANETRALFKSIQGKSFAEINKLECAEHLVGIAEGLLQATSGITDVKSTIDQDGTLSLISNGIWLGAEGLGAVRVALSKGGSGATERHLPAGNPQSGHLDETRASHAAAHPVPEAQMPQTIPTGGQRR